jgi:hypothetical protein
MYAVGAFLAFTLSQAGMVMHWRKAGAAASGKSMALNALGRLPWASRAAAQHCGVM